MITNSGPKVLEYNVRFGDPETQTLLPLLSADTDLAQIMIACTEHWLDGVDIKIDPRFSATVVAAAGGYPGPYIRGDIITLDPAQDETLVFHAGTSSVDGQLTTSGGRVIAATAAGDSLEEAVRRAYKGMNTIHFDKMYYRKDIAHRYVLCSHVCLECKELKRGSAFEAGSPKGGPSMTYASAGVSIDAGNTLVSLIKSCVRSTRRSGADAEIGGFGGTFDLAAAGYSKPPVVVGAIDGVGTKLKVAQAVGKHDTVGIDLVAMNVNDLVVQGAEPLFFLDCYSCGKLDVDTAAAFVKGVAEGCRQSGCALIGGETAEMPGLYTGNDYDAVGAAVGAVEKGKILPDTESMVEGDVLLGLASNGLHSNGFSLVRKVIELNGLSFNDPAPWDERISVGLSLLTPTRIYVKPVLGAVRKGVIKGMAHITGGGLVENVPRMLPNHLAAKIDVSRWSVPPVFAWLKKAGNISSIEFGRAFNTGLGMVLVVSKDNVKAVVAELEDAEESVFEVGMLVRRNGEGCVLEGLEAWERDITR